MAIRKNHPVIPSPEEISKLALEAATQASSSHHH